MTMHARDALVEFQNGETRLVYARDAEAPDERLFFMPDGAARALKAQTADGRFRCFVPGCDANLRIVARENRRDGFSHGKNAGRHSPESFHHLQGKEAVLRWVEHFTSTKRWDNITCTTEHRLLDGERVADVFVEAPGVSPVAVEVQYAGIPVDAWRQRTASYCNAGIYPLWLFGHVGANLRPSRSHQSGLRLTESQQKSIAYGLPVWWLNPVEGLLGGVHVGDRYPLPGEVEVEFECWPLEDCLVTPFGIQTPVGALRENATRDEVSRRRIAREDVERKRRERNARARAKWQAQIGFRRSQPRDTRPAERLNILRGRHPYLPMYEQPIPDQLTRAPLAGSARKRSRTAKVRPASEIAAEIRAEKLAAQGIPSCMVCGYRADPDLHGECRLCAIGVAPRPR